MKKFSTFALSAVLIFSSVSAFAQSPEEKAEMVKYGDAVAYTAMGVGTAATVGFGVPKRIATSYLNFGKYSTFLIDEVLPVTRRMSRYDKIPLAHFVELKAGRPAIWGAAAIAAGGALKVEGQAYLHDWQISDLVDAKKLRPVLTGVGYGAASEASEKPSTGGNIR